MRDGWFDEFLGCGFGMLIWAYIFSIWWADGFDAALSALGGISLLLAAIWLVPVFFVPMGLAGWAISIWFVCVWLVRLCRYFYSKVA